MTRHSQMEPDANDRPTKKLCFGEKLEGQSLDNRKIYAINLYNKLDKKCVDDNQMWLDNQNSNLVEMQEVLEQWKIGHSNAHTLDNYTAYLKDFCAQLSHYSIQKFDRFHASTLNINLRFLVNVLLHLYTVQNHVIKSDLDSLLLIDAYEFVIELMEQLTALKASLPDKGGQNSCHCVYLLALCNLILSNTPNTHEDYIDEAFTLLIGMADKVPANSPSLSSINTLLLHLIGLPCQTASKYRIKLFLINYNEALTKNNTEAMQQHYNALVLEKSIFPHAQIPTSVEFNADMAKAYVKQNNKPMAKTMYLTSLQTDKYNLVAINGLLELLHHEKMESVATLFHAKFLDSQITALQSLLNKSMKLSGLCSGVVGLFENVMQGHLGAYEMLKPEFNRDKQAIQCLSDFFHCHNDEELKIVPANALYDMALFLDRKEIVGPEMDGTCDHINRLLQIAASQNFALAHYRLGRIAQEQFDFYNSMAHFEKASELSNKEARKRLISVYSCDRQYEKAFKLLDDKIFNTDELKRYRNRIKFLQLLSESNKPFKQVEARARVIYFDFDNTLMKSQELPGTFYELYPGGIAPTHINAEDFYTGSKEQWQSIFNELNQLGFSIGICTARFSKPSDNCMLFQQFLQDFGDYLNHELVFFTEGKQKYTFLMEACEANKILPQNAILVDDLQTHCEEASACGLNVIHAAHLVLKPDSFSFFKAHLIQMATETKNQCVEKRFNEHQLFHPKNSPSKKSTQEFQVRHRV